MKKTLVSRKRIQQELLKSFKRGISIIVLLVICVMVGLTAGVYHLINFINGVYINDTVADSVFSLSIGAISILLIVVFLLKFYFINLIKIKRNRFEIIEDELCQKVKETVSYFHRRTSENSLYFPCGRIAVSQEVYSSSKVGDRFYIVVLKSKNRVPQLVFHTKYYEIVEYGNHLK